MATEFRDEMLDEILQGARTQEELFGPQGIVNRLTAAVIQRALRSDADVGSACTRAVVPAETGQRRPWGGQASKGQYEQTENAFAVLSGPVLV